MNKLGFYTKNFGAPGVIDAIKNIKPPVLLTELDDFSILKNIRNDWSPDTFVIGRFFFPGNQQGAMLDHTDPASEGRKLAERCLTHNFGFGKLRGDNDQLFISAWMSLNEGIRGPNSFTPHTEWAEEDQQNFAKMERHAAAYDSFQVAFLQRLREEGAEAVAFNFAAGNWIRGEDYIKYFPKTLENYTYLGFHEYGWPHMSPQVPNARSGCGYYREIMRVIRQKYGNRHKVIITEAGLARMYKHVTDGGGDVGWLYPQDSVSQESYKESLRWYNGLLSQDNYALGACLFQVGPGIDWETFRHTGQDNQGNPITLMDELQAMAQEPPPESTSEVFAASAAIEADLSVDDDLVETLRATGQRLVIPLNQKSELYKTAQQKDLGQRLTDEYEVLHNNSNYSCQIFEGGLVYAPTGQWDGIQIAPASVTRAIADLPAIAWTQKVTGFHGNRWYYWEQFLQDKIPGLTWHIFMEEVVQHNPELAEDGFIFKAHKTYKMPLVGDQLETANAANIEATPQMPTQPVVLTTSVPAGFFQAVDGRFQRNGQPMRFIGANIRGLVHYGHDPAYFKDAPVEHRKIQLQAASDMNVRLVRVFLAHKDATPEQVEGRLRDTINLIRTEFPNIYLLPALTNLYEDVPFYVRGDEKYYEVPPGGGKKILNHTFYQKGYTENYLPFVKHIVNAFKDEPHIFAWEIGNELKAEGAPELLVDFMKTISTQIKSWDPHHMVTTGMISTRHAWMGERQDLRQVLYSHPHLDFITIHAYNGNEPPPEDPNAIEDDSDLARHFGKPFIIEEAGFDVTRYHDRPEKTRTDLANWFGNGASCYMPWGFVGTPFDNNDGDRKVGMTGPLHMDWSQLFELHKKCGHLLLNKGFDPSASSAIANLDYRPPARGLPVQLPWPLITDGFDFPVGKPDGRGYYVAAGLADQAYHAEHKVWHTGEDWNRTLNPGDNPDIDWGDPVFAVANGRVVTSHRFPVWGNIILIEHRLPWGQTVWSQYAHLKQRFVRKGDVVQRGEQIGSIGKGDNDKYAAHLHFEIRLKKLPASKSGWKTQKDLDKVLRWYAHPTNFINSLRSR